MWALVINAGIVIAVLIALYFVIKRAVKDGIKEAYQESGLGELLQAMRHDR
ncbi:MAG: DUF6019 family protein [Roseburia sp.]|nr:DUF6019 family protein [Roseburia sp.]MCM1098975.1 DUF6019 family protein [Ruminococcus flavefaciens]